MSPKAKILLVEDEVAIADFIATLLRAEDYEVRVERDGMDGYVAAHREPPDLVILDRLLPGLDGLEVCRRLSRTTDVPILMLTALGKPHERVEGLESGASDYLPKPFDLDELLARVRVQLRRRGPSERTILEVGDLRLDRDTREVWRGQQAIAMTAMQFDLLAYLATPPRRVRTRAEILAAVWGDDFVGDDNVLEVFIRRLRTRLEPPSSPRLIHTVRGVGYMLRESPLA